MNTVLTLAYVAVMADWPALTGVIVVPPTVATAGVPDERVGVPATVNPSVRVAVTEESVPVW